MKRQLASLDTEDNGKNKIYWIVFYDGSNYYNFKTKADTIKFLNRQKLEIWCCNLEYDIFNIFSLEEFFEKCHFKFGDRLLKVKYRDSVFYDTVNLWKFSVKQMGDIVGLPKYEKDFKSLSYCQRDTRIVYEFVNCMKNEMKNLKIPVKLTISSTAFNYWRKVFWKKPLLRVPVSDLKYLHNAYYGGRCECFYIGKIKGNILFYDVNSMYPSVMLNEYPYPFNYKRKPDIDEFGVTECLVFSNLKLPILPYRTKNGKLIFPNGTFRGIWDNEELRFAISKGVKLLKIYSGFTYNYKCLPFKEYIEKIYSLRKHSQNEYQKIIFKSLMNSLYGKFAQVNDGVRIISLYDFLGKEFKNIDDFKVIQNSIVIYKNKYKQYPIFCNMIWALHTTALARIKLYNYIIELSKYGDVIYCDTDSIFLSVKNNKKVNIAISNELGELKLAGKYQQIEIISNKFYRYGDKVLLYKKVKGIPYSNMQDFIENKKTTFKKPIRLKEGLRRHLPINLWLNHTKQMRSDYDKGVVLKSGYVKPYKIS